MTHIHYYMQYSSTNKPFVYREGPNPAFHEGIANAIGLCVGGPVHLQRLGILKTPIIATTGNSMINIEYLLTVALDKLPFMAFSIALEKVRFWVNYDKQFSWRALVRFLVKTLIEGAVTSKNSHRGRSSEDFLVNYD